jgi:hypothetical protein
MRVGESGIRGRSMGDSLTKTGSYMRGSSRIICRTEKVPSSRVTLFKEFTQEGLNSKGTSRME